MMIVKRLCNKRLAGFFILYTAFALVFSASMALAASDPVFTVQNVKVDITSDNAAEAREEAFSQAQQDAFKLLAERLLSESELEYFQLPPTSTISTLVNDFEITDEQLSSVRYIGTYTFRFKKDAVRSHLGGGGFSYTDVGSKPVLVLPYYQWGATTVLWGEDNPWLKAWNNTASRQGLVPVVVPIGDLQDVSDIGDNQALTYEQANLENMVGRYRAGEGIIMLAIPGWNSETGQTNGDVPDTLQVMMYQTEFGPQFLKSIHVQKSDAKSGETIFKAAARSARDLLQKDWKSKTLVNAYQTNKLKVRVMFGTMQEWMETQKKLRQVQGIDEVKLVSLKPSQANLELMFTGSEDRLRLALSQADMTLTTPRIDFSNVSAQQSAYQQGGWGYQNAYMGTQSKQHSPLVYDLFLNKYHRQ